jgi:hypothetical protein
MSPETYPSCIHEEQAFEESRGTIRDHLKNVGHEISSLKPSEEGARDLREDMSRRRTSRWNPFIQRISKSEAAGFYSGEEQAKP